MGVEKFSGGLRSFWRVEIFSVGVEIFSGGIEFFFGVMGIISRGVEIF